MNQVDICKELLRHKPDDETVYQEVPIAIDGEMVSADIITVTPIDWIKVTEVDRLLTHRVQFQACRWLQHANEVWIAVEQPLKKTKIHAERSTELLSFGIGLIYVSTSMIFPATQALRRGHRDELIAKALCLGQLDSVAGSAGVKRAKADKWESVRRLLENAPQEGITAKELFAELECSYVDQTEFLRDAPKGRLRQIGCMRLAVPYRFYLLGSKA